MKAILNKGIIESKSFFELRNVIVEFKENGGGQKEAEKILNELKTEFKDDEAKEEIILDLLDIITGWCQDKYRIWKDDWKKLAEKYDNKDWAFSSTYVWQKIVEENPTNFNLAQYSDQLRLSGNYLKALQIFNKIEINKIPQGKKYLYHVLKGRIYQDKGELGNAIACFRESVKLEPNNTYPYIYLGTSLSTLSELEDAKNVLENALEKEGDIDEVNYNLSLIYARQSDFEKAIALMEDCLEIDPEYPNAKVWLDDFKNMIRMLNNE